MMGPGMMGFGTFGLLGMIISFLFSVVVIVGIVWLVVWAVRRAGGNNIALPGRPAAPSAKEILQTRYARGEINREEYLAMLEDLR